MSENNEVRVGRFDEDSAITRIVKASNLAIKLQAKSKYQRARNLLDTEYTFAFSCYETFDNKDYWFGVLKAVKEHEFKIIDFQTQLNQPEEQA